MTGGNVGTGKGEEAILDDPIKSNGSKIEGDLWREVSTPKTGNVPPSTPFAALFSLNSTRHDCDHRPPRVEDEIKLQLSAGLMKN